MTVKKTKPVEKTTKMIAHQLFTAVGSVAFATSTSMITYAATLNAHGIPVAENLGDSTMIAICVTAVSAGIVYLTRPIPTKAEGYEAVDKVIYT